MWHSMFSSSGTEFLIRHIFFLLSHDLPFLVMHLTYLYPTYPRFWDAFPCRRVLIWPSPTLRSGLYSVTFTDSQNETCFWNFPEGWSTPSYPYQSSFSYSQQAFSAAISCFCFLHITPVLYGHTVRNNINFHWSEPGYRSVLFVRSKPFVWYIIHWMNLATVPYFTYHTRHLSGISASWWPISPAFLALALTFLKETNFSHRHWHCSSSHCKLSLGPFHGHFHDAIPRDSMFAWTCHLASRVPYQWSHVERGFFFLVVSNLFILVLVCFRHVC